MKRVAESLGFAVGHGPTPVSRTNAGEYMLLRDGNLVIGDKYDASLDEIEAFLEAEGARRLSTQPTDGAKH